MQEYLFNKIKTNTCYKRVKYFYAMIKKLLIATGLLFGLIGLFLLMTRLTGYWAVYNTPTPSNEPGIKLGEKILATKFIAPKPYSFITFRSHYKDSLVSAMGIEQHNAQYVHRLCGMPGDRLEMRNGILFVNNKNFDIDINLKLEFIVSKEDATKTNTEDFSESELRPASYTGSNDSMVITLDSGLLKKYSGLIKLSAFYITDTSFTRGVFKWLNRKSRWTVDNFGPLKIPADSCFVLGDNRHNALDSRYTGYVAINDITGVVFRKF